MGLPIEFKHPKDRIIVACDTGDLSKIRRLTDQMMPRVGMIKFGPIAYLGNGHTVFYDWDSNRVVHGDRVMFDFKLHDIPNTVEKATGTITARIRARLATMHIAAGPAAMKRAVNVAGNTTLMLGITVLSSVTGEDLARDHLLERHELVEMFDSFENLRYQVVVSRAVLAKECGLAGVVCSGEDEIRAVRKACGPDFLIVAPGIRFKGGDAHDQKAVLDPETAIAAGADMLVIGRAITQAKDIDEAVQHAIAEIEKGLARRAA